MTDHKDTFLSYLQKHNLKLTQPRKLILEAAFAVHDHFTAEKLYRIVKEQSSLVSLATVYRTLPLLVDAGLIQQSLRSSSRDAYEHILGHPKHIHWICSVCGSVVETDLKDVIPHIELEAAKLHFLVGDLKLNVSGRCWKCQTSENENQ